MLLTQNQRLYKIWEQSFTTASSNKLDSLLKVNNNGFFGIYIGSFDNNNHFDGKGAMISYDGRLLFQGQFKNNQKHGLGTKMKISKTSNYCKVKTGKYIQGIPDGQFTAQDIHLTPQPTQMFILPWRIAQAQILPHQVQR